MTSKYSYVGSRIGRGASGIAAQSCRLHTHEVAHRKHCRNICKGEQEVYNLCTQPCRAGGVSLLSAQNLPGRFAVNDPHPPPPTSIFTLNFYVVIFPKLKKKTIGFLVVAFKLLMSKTVTHIGCIYLSLSLPLSLSNTNTLKVDPVGVRSY